MKYKASELRSKNPLMNRLQRKENLRFENEMTEWENRKQKKEKIMKGSKNFHISKKLNFKEKPKPVRTLVRKRDSRKVGKFERKDF